VMPSLDGGDDFVGIGGPLEGLGMSVVVFDEPVDGFLELGHRSEDAALEPSLVRMAKNPSTALSQEAEVGVKWKVQRR
jgi:hypothetical protein